MIDLRLGDCRSVLLTISDSSIDAIIADPPYPCIDRDYGRMTEAEWHAMMREVVTQSRRILKPTGSAVFILQTNSRKVGSIRPWLFEFQAWICREWNMVQDAYWWNTSALPVGGAPRHGLMRPSVKHAVWAGPSGCYRDQASVLQAESASNRSKRVNGRYDPFESPSRRRSPTEATRDDVRRMRNRCVERSGTTPFNLIAMGTDGRWSGGTHGHGASTPRRICDWWTRYICPPGGVICDPFMGSGTTGLSALKYGCEYIGIEKMCKYHAVAERRIKNAQAEAPLLAACR